MKCQIELLSPSILAAEPDLVREIDRMQFSLGLELGWHYILDLVWILSRLRDLKPSAILDAGAGQGLLQFMLAEEGHSVISVDFAPRRFTLPARLVFKFRTLNNADSSDPYLKHLRSRHLDGASPFKALANIGWLAIFKLGRNVRAILALRFLIKERRALERKPASILVYQSRIERMDHLDDDSVDVVVSISALEHMEPTAIKQAIKEFRRVLKPGGRVIVTTSAAEKGDFYHQPSLGWCFAEQSLRDLFGLGRACPSNWSVYSEILSRLRKSRQLRHRLSPTYRVSGANGMPWGVWDPKYVPAGVAFTVGR